MSHAVIGFHDDADGYAAALAAVQNIESYNAVSNIPRTWEAHTVQYSQDNRMFWDAVRGKDRPIVYLVDFTLPLEEMRELAFLADHVYWVDHHIGVKDTHPDWVINDVPANVSATFDPTQAACVLAWEKFTQYVPRVIKYIGDRDIWKFALPDSVEVNAGINHVMRGFRKQADETSQDVLRRFESMLGTIDCDDFLAIGKVIAENTAMIASNYERKVVKLLVGDMTYPLVIVASHSPISEIGNHLAKTRQATVVLAFPLESGHWQLSFRGLDTTSSSQEAARALGGNGHRNAAGARIAWEQFVPCSEGFKVCQTLK